MRPLAKILTINRKNEEKNEREFFLPPLSAMRASKF